MMPPISGIQGQESAEIRLLASALQDTSHIASLMQPCRATVNICTRMLSLGFAYVE